MYLKPLLAERKFKPPFHPTIPVLDLNDFHHPKSRPQFIQELSQALKDVGFFAVLNPGVNQKALDAAYLAAESFFAESTEVKMACHDPNNNGCRGYVPSETAKESTTKDFKEFFHVGPETQASIKPNLWPQNPHFKQATTSLFNALEQHIHPIQQALALSLDCPEDFFCQMTTGGELKLRAIHYPANPPKDAIWAAAHTDIDLFTILPRSTNQGLQVKNKLGIWVDVKVPEDAFIINAGDMLENLTNGLYRSSHHRVIHRAGQGPRLSMVMFVHPKTKDDLSPLDSCIQRTGGIAKFPTASQEELLAERMVDLGLASDETLTMLANSGLVERLIDLGRASPRVLQTLKINNLASGKILDTIAQFEANLFE